MITLECVCGHRAPFPQDSVNLVCTKCERRLEVRWFDGPACYEQWRAWAARKALERAKAVAA